MDDNSNIKQAIAELQQTKEAVLPLLADNTMLQVRTETALNRLISGFEMVSGITGANGEKGNGLKPLKNFMGKRLAERKELSVKKTSQSDVDLLRDTAKAIYENFLDRENKELHEAVSDIEMRAVAKLAGIKDISSTKPAKITDKFISEIKAAIKKQKALKKEQEDLVIKEDHEGILTGMKFERDDKAKSWKLGDHVITDEQIMDVEFFDKFISQIKA